MKKLRLGIGSVLSAAIVASGLCAVDAHAIGWPANYQGVMLQGFSWDSYNGTNNSKWTTLTGRADELSKYFKLIWVPNSARAASNPGMGYDPVYWFTNHNSAFGTEAEVRSMIQTFKSKGTGIIEDVVINHRSGKSNWVDFPAETWNGKTYQLKAGSITSGDEVWSNSNTGATAEYRGGADTGEDFNGSRDLDHTNANVQENCKAYTQFLLQDMGYAGFRYDMVKGYAPQYTRMYNQASKPTYSVGEYWDGSYDACAAWIEGTGKESAAFDFPGKYQINKCFNGGAHNYTELVWKANGTTDQPAGLIHFGYAQLAVTFVDNHDTYRDGSKMTGDVLQANAFILSSPGTPCVFWEHYNQYKSQIQAMIDARNGVGLHNCSPVTVLEVNGNCYVAEATGTKGKLWVKLGNSSRTPGNGYTKKASGNGYEIWTTGEGGDEPNPGPEPPTGDAVTIAGDYNLAYSGSHSYIYCWPTGGDGAVAWPGSQMSTATGSDGRTYKVFKVPEGNDNVIFNDGNGSQTADLKYSGSYIMDDNGATSVRVTFTDEPGPGPEPPTGDVLYILGNLAVGGWDTTPGTGFRMTGSDNVFEASDVEFTAAGDNTTCYFNLTDYVGATWDELNEKANRYGAATEGEAVAPGTPAPIVLYANNVSAMGCLSWTIEPGIYDVRADLNTMTLTVTGKTEGVGAVGADSRETLWFNLQGQRVENPAGGVFIMVRGSRAVKVAR